MCSAEPVGKIWGTADKGNEERSRDMEMRRPYMEGEAGKDAGKRLEAYRKGMERLKDRKDGKQTQGGKAHE